MQRKVVSAMLTTAISVRREQHTALCNILGTSEVDVYGINDIFYHLGGAQNDVRVIAAELHIAGTTRHLD
jgi:hypothetical protein